MKNLFRYGDINYCRMSPADLRAARANRVLRTDKKRIRTQNAVIVNGKASVGVLSKIADCARIRFSSARKRRSARTVFRPRHLWNVRKADETQDESGFRASCADT